ncbi:hypothetical protein [Haloferula rosea]|uniref:Uncharacterized protein n=1 Tax=Haloferula rosea TaxID=490093 RepID=A0A934R9E4_9BACT|nr:hypothetical protein [Haloferula rosea]MBK1826345.1 hypothetical protein [Haloferula rosea]
MALISKHTLMRAAGPTLLLLASGIVIQRVSPAGNHPEIGSESTELHSSTWKIHERDRSPERRLSREEVDAKAAEWFEFLLERYPWLQVNFRQVPDADNGFLLYLELLEDYQGGADGTALPLPAPILSMLDDPESFSAEVLAKWLENNQGLMERILAVAEAPDRSVNGMAPRDISFIEARPAVQIADLLMLEARLSLKNGDPGRSMRNYKAAMNLAEHFDGMETPSLFSKTVAIILRNNTHQHFVREVLPTITNNPASLADWRVALRHDEEFSDSIKTLRTGEWHISTRSMLLPGLVSDGATLGETDMKVPDPQALLDLLAESLRSGFSQLSENASSESIVQAFTLDLPKATLSQQANELASICEVGFKPWLHGLNRNRTSLAMTDALMAIALNEEPVVDPVSGEPFRWDPDTRTLHPPAGSENIESLALP